MIKYNCSICGRPYEVTPEEDARALAAAKKEFGPVFEGEPWDPVCNVCYAVLSPLVNPDIIEKSKNDLLNDKRN